MAEVSAPTLRYPRLPPQPTAKSTARGTAVGLERPASTFLECQQTVALALVPGSRVGVRCGPANLGRFAPEIGQFAGVEQRLPLGPRPKQLVPPPARLPFQIGQEFQGIGGQNLGRLVRSNRSDMTTRSYAGTFAGVDGVRVSWLTCRHGRARAGGAADATSGRMVRNEVRRQSAWRSIVSISAIGV